MTDRNLLHLSKQQTIGAPIAFVGIGLHSGERVHMRLQPAPAGQGITLVRRDLPAGEQRFKVHWEAVKTSTLCTAIGNSFGHEVSTIEHLLSALAGLSIDNLTIELDGPEIPIMDGSARPFVEAIDNAGIVAQDARRSVIVIKRPICLQQGESSAELLPDISRRITVSIHFDERVIGTQSMSIDLTPSVYRREIAAARTFGFAEQLDQLRRWGLAQGGSIMNAILVRGGRVANVDGLRFRDEFVRHKVLDVVGDLALAGMPIIGHYRGNRPGHQLNTDLLALLMEDKDAWVQVDFDELDGVLDEIAEPDYTATQRYGAESWLKDDKRPQRSFQNPVNNRIRRLFGDR